jgi:hypothetical protein
MDAGASVPPDRVTWPDATPEGTRAREQQCQATEAELRRSLHEVSAVEEMAEIAGTAEPEPEEAETEATAVTES